MKKTYRICWLETNIVTATVEAKSSTAALQNFVDNNGDLATLVYGYPLPDSAWVADDPIPESIIDLADSQGADISQVEDELERLKSPAHKMLLRVIESCKPSRRNARIQEVA